MRAINLIKDEVTVKKRLQKYYSPLILLGIRRTDNQIGKKKYQCNNGSFLEEVTSAYKSHLESKTAVFYFIVVTQPLKYNSNKTMFSNPSRTLKKKKLQQCRW